ncbi:hypothetical protein A1O1_04181 [Capronia coronata CBS 617.96]|uniref:Zn(2)-C6 fungal-type domain-containing protein n=1 Tax=Capronia coronata CBS 617.96 TaxID=1182541 RepID=W9Z985_9EURO|nr:uncharacterized protein A1O1_04181 [Capronia coronata CBS 617.96]EXJ91074.1 hypothetical protein A1O1_04181 [Capronia coronata CBS 617.96]
MATKRPHTKSRKGCVRCKQRHIKCDEKGPPCSNCEIRHLDCSYTRTLSPSSASDKAKACPVSHGVHQSSPSSIGPLDDANLNASGVVRPSTPSGSSRMQELELMQYWCTETCHSFTAKHTDMFRTSVVHEALSQEYLMDAILAFTAVHKACRTTDAVAAASYVRAGLQYHNRALSTLQSRLQTLVLSECGAVFTCSIIAMASAIVLPLLPHGGCDQPGSSIESVCHLYEFMRGITSVVELGRQWLENGPFRTVFGDHFDGDGSCMSQEDTAAFLRRLRACNDQIHGAESPSPSGRHRVYARAIDRFEKVFSAHKFRTVQWLVDAGDEVIQGLRQQEPVALMIFIHWGMLLDKLEELWWAKYLGQRLMKELLAAFSRYGLIWNEAVKLTDIQIGLARGVSNGQTGAEPRPV